MCGATGFTFSKKTENHAKPCIMLQVAKCLMSEALLCSIMFLIGQRVKYKRLHIFNLNT